MSKQLNLNNTIHQGSVKAFRSSGFKSPNEGIVVFEEAGMLSVAWLCFRLASSEENR